MTLSPQQPLTSWTLTAPLEPIDPLDQLESHRSKSLFLTCAFSSVVEKAGETPQSTLHGFSMSDKSDSTFDRPRPLSTSHLELHSNSYEPIDLITFIAVAQKLNIRFLPITWQGARGSIGRGGTSNISQAVVNEDTSFAFKRIAERDKVHESDDTLFQRLICEIVVLRHRGLGIYLAPLEGICWEVVPSRSVHEWEEEETTCVSVDKIWPVHVLEATLYGDLYSF